MNVKKFLNIEIEEAPPELQLSVEMRCREIMASNEINDIILSILCSFEYFPVTFKDKFIFAFDFILLKLILSI